MMDIEVTRMMEAIEDAPPLVGSVAELGRDAGRITWNNSKAFGREQPLLDTEAQRDAARDHFRGYGAWDDETIDNWSEEELQGIMVQEVAHAIREAGDALNDAEEYRRLCEEGTLSGRLYCDDEGKWWFYLGD